MEALRNDRQAYFSGFCYTGENRKAKTNKNAEVRFPLVKAAFYVVSVVIVLAVVKPFIF